MLCTTQTVVLRASLVLLPPVRWVLDPARVTLGLLLGVDRLADGLGLLAAFGALAPSSSDDTPHPRVARITHPSHDFCLSSGGLDKVNYSKACVLVKA